MSLQLITTPGGLVALVVRNHLIIHGDTVDVTGDLTIKGTTHSVTVPLEYQGAVIDPWGNERIGFEGSVVVNRKDWGLTWNAAIESGGVLVSERRRQRAVGAKESA